MKLRCHPFQLFTSRADSDMPDGNAVVRPANAIIGQRCAGSAASRYYRALVEKFASVHALTAVISLRVQALRAHNSAVRHALNRARLPTNRAAAIFEFARQEVHYSKSMRSLAPFVVGVIFIPASLHSQQPRELKASGHQLSETAEQFFSAGAIGDLVRACQAKDWKTVRLLSKSADQYSRPDAKAICATTDQARKRAMSGARIELAGKGDPETLRQETFTLDGGHVVRLVITYSNAIAEVAGYHPKSYDELLQGLQQAYGPSTKTNVEPVLDTFGVKADAHRAEWLSDHDIITLIERPGSGGYTQVIAETLAEHNRTPESKSANPLQ